MNTLLALITCSYSFFGAPFTQLGFEMTADGVPGPYVQVTPTGGRMSEFPFTLVAAAPDEMFHGWISKGTENELEVILYKQERPDGRSKLINPQAPMGKVMWGTCNF